MGRSVMRVSASAMLHYCQKPQGARLFRRHELLLFSGWADRALRRSLRSRHRSRSARLFGRAHQTHSREGCKPRKTATRKPNVTFIAFPLGERQRVIELVTYLAGEHSNQCQKAKSRKGCSYST